uniref:Tudor domain-containing protein n=1 Tax=Loa loa TaxID=7209 RepID=A0A1I7W2I7_LOALO
MNKFRAATLTGDSSRCRGVAFGSYTMANLPCDVWCDVTVVAFESLEDVQVRGPEQSIRLMYLERFLDSVYGNEELRGRLAFETGVHISEGLACVAWDAINQVGEQFYGKRDLGCTKEYRLIREDVDSSIRKENRKAVMGKRWIRARVTCTSGDRSVVDVISVDYPSITLRSLKFRDGEIYMLRTDLLFPPLCCSIRAIDATDKLETFTKSTVAKEVLQVGTHVRVYSPASSTLSFIELVNGLKLEEYIEHAVERLDRLYFTSGRGSHADVTSFSSSMSFPRTVLVPQERHFEPFSYSLSLGQGSQRQTLPLRCGISSLQPSKQNVFNSLAKNCLTSVPPSPIMPVSSLSSSSSSSSSSLSSQSHFKTPKLLPRSTVELPQIPLRENPSRISLPLHKKQRKPLVSLTSSTGPSAVVVRPSPPLHNSDSYSENSDPLREKSVQVEVLNINCATEIFLNTAETKLQYEALRNNLSYIDNTDLLPVAGSWCSQNEHYLFWFNDCWNRVKILAREDDDWKVLCIDTGEEKYVKYNSRFYRLPKQLSIEEWPPTCLGPLRLCGSMDARWLSIGARIFLRSICEKTLHLTAVFGKGESDRSIMLYDEKGRCLNDQFVKFIEKQTLIK